jgi:hypothetical protein
MTNEGRLTAYTKITVGSLAAASAFGSAHAAIVLFDVDPAKTIGVAGIPTPNQTLSFTDINIGAGTYNSSIGYGPPTVSGPSLWFTITGENQFTAAGAGDMKLSFDFNYPTSPDNLQSFSAGQEIGTGTKYTAGPIAGWNGSGTGYVGLQFTDAGTTATNFGWLELDYVANGASTTLTVGGFAFEDTPGSPINAGAVPEPSTYALLALAGLFGAAVWHHRRRQTGGASPALLQLAAGACGLEKFRAGREA